jgi:hypothetical protein
VPGSDLPAIAAFAAWPASRLEVRFLAVVFAVAVVINAALRTALDQWEQ